MALASTILDRAEKTLDFDRSSIGVQGLESTQLLAVLSDIVLEYFSSFEKNGEPSSILSNETGFDLVTDTALDGSTDKGDTSFDVSDSSGLGTSGALAVWDNRRPDYIEFTGNDLSTTISGVTGLDFGHDDKRTVSLLYAIPSNFKSMRSTVGYEDAVSVDGIPYFFTTGAPYLRRYSIYDNGTTKYLHFPQGITGGVYMKYNAAPTTVDDETDNVDIPTVDEWYAVWRLVEYAAPKLEDFAMQQLAVDKAFKILSSSHKRRNIGKRPRLRPMRRFFSRPSRSFLFDT